MRSTRPLIIILTLAITSLACLGTATQSVSKDLLFSDDFSDTSKKWDQVTDGSRTTDYYSDAYRIVVNDAYSYAWANPQDEIFTDTENEVDATKNAGPDDNGFGVICRYTDVDKFYYGFLSNDGYYAIMKMTPGGESPIGRDNMLESSEILQGSATNHIRFDCVGSTLTLYVNGHQLDQQTDAEYITGNVGLIAGTFSTAGADILFDNFSVFKP